MAQETIFRKVGRKYVPVGEYDPAFMDHWPYGINMVVVRDGHTMYRYQVDPNTAGLLGAGLMCKDAIAKAIHQAAEMRPNPAPVSERARELWEELREELGAGAYFLEYPAVSEIANAAIRELHDQFEEIVKDEGAREAFNRFLTIAYLTKE